MIKIKQLFDEITKQKVYPITTLKAVKDPKSKKSLSDLMIVGEDEEIIGELGKRDCDTLGGKYKSTDIDSAMTCDEDEGLGEVEDVTIVDADRLGGKYTAEDVNSLKQRIVELETENEKLNNSLSTKIPFSFGIDSDGNYGYIKAGADAVTPFKNGIKGFGVFHLETENKRGDYYYTSFDSNLSSSASGNFSANNYSHTETITFKESALISFCWDYASRGTDPSSIYVKIGNIPYAKRTLYTINVTAGTQLVAYIKGNGSGVYSLGFVIC